MEIDVQSTLAMGNLYDSDLKSLNIIKQLIYFKGMNSKDDIPRKIQCNKWKGKQIHWTTA